MRRREGLLGWLFVSPALAHLVVFALAPIGYALYVSLFKVHLIRGDERFVGISNYTFALGEESFLTALWNSARYALVSVPVGMAVALGVAILVTRPLMGVGFFRVAFYVPAISSGVAIAMLWTYVYLPETGLLNVMLGAMGLDRGTSYLSDPRWAMWALVFMSIWVGLGPKMVLFSAGLLGIPQSYYEAAEIDGAGGARRFWSITLPLLAPTTLFVLVTSTIGALHLFTPVYMMTRGGPEGTTDVVGYHIYTEAWVNFNTGLASAKSFLLLVLVAAISIVQFRLMRRRLEGFVVS